MDREHHEHLDDHQEECETIILCQKRYHIVALGDSNTAGAGTEHGSYVNKFVGNWNSCFKGKMTGWNFGKNGMDSNELVAIIEKEKVKKAIEGADIIFINIGGNDIANEYAKGVNFFQLNRVFNCIKSRYLRNMEFIIQTIKSYNCEAIIVVNGLYSPFCFRGIVNGVVNKYLYDWNCCLRKTLEPYHVMYVPVNRILADYNKNCLLADDHIHLNDKGSQLIADYIGTRIQACE